MSAVLAAFIPIMLIAVAIVLVLGLANMLRAGPGNRSQSLMRWRVILQFVAVVVMMAAVYFAQS